MSCAVFSGNVTEAADFVNAYVLDRLDVSAEVPQVQAIKMSAEERAPIKKTAEAFEKGYSATYFRLPFSVNTDSHSSQGNTLDL